MVKKGRRRRTRCGLDEGKRRRCECHGAAVLELELDVDLGLRVQGGEGVDEGKVVVVGR